MKKIRIIKVASFILTFLPVILAVIFLKDMPDRVPTHYDINGMVDGYGSKYSAIAFPIICIVLSAIMVISANICKKREIKNESMSNYEAMHIINLGILVIFNVIASSIIYTSVNGITNLNSLPVPFDRMLFAMIGALYILIGVLVGKSTSAVISGIKYEYKNKKTPKKMGRSLIYTGILNIIVNILTGNIFITLGVLLVSSFISTILVLVFSTIDN